MATKQDVSIVLSRSPVVEHSSSNLITGAAFLEFHEPLAAWLNPETALSGNDTLLASGELYNNFVKVDVTYRNSTAL